MLAFSIFHFLNNLHTRNYKENKDPLPQQFIECWHKILPKACLVSYTKQSMGYALINVGKAFINKLATYIEEMGSLNVVRVGLFLKVYATK